MVVVEAPTATTELFDEEIRQGVAALVREQLREELKHYRRRATIVLFSGEMDRAMVALAMANAAAASGIPTTVFFTYWGLTALRVKSVASGKTGSEKLLSTMLPADFDALPLSSMNFGGMGAMFLKNAMKAHRVSSLGELLAEARDRGVQLVACETSMGLLGFREHEFVAGSRTGSMQDCVENASDSTMTFFV
jgi:peroxiredoxin family protein